MHRSITTALSALILAAGLTCTTAHAQTTLKYAGVNLAGAEFNSGAMPGTLYKNYMYPSDADFAYFADRKMNVIRLPFLWERLQPQAGAPLDAAQLSYLKTAVTRAKNHGLTLILDPHNYAKYYGQFIGTGAASNAVFADLWRRLGAEFANDDKVIFGLMNEPYNMNAATWASAAQAGIDAIRATGAKNLVLVPGVSWTGAHSWNSAAAGGGISNGDALANLRDSANRLAYEVHQYMDADSSGTSATCVSTTIGADKLRGFTDWLRSHHKVGFLGEFGAANNSTCMVALDNMLGHMQANADVWLGWTYWAAGSWWGNYMFNVHPDSAGNPKPQMQILADRAAMVVAGAALPVTAPTAPPVTAAPAIIATPAPSKVAAVTTLTKTPSSSKQGAAKSTSTKAAKPKPAPVKPAKAKRG